MYGWLAVQLYAGCAAPRAMLGKVESLEGYPIPQVAVTLEPLNLQMQSDSSGSFQFPEDAENSPLVKDELYQLQITCEGYQNQSVEIAYTGGIQELPAIILKPSELHVPYRPDNFIVE
jgi:hypothetical protein